MADNETHNPLRKELDYYKRQLKELAAQTVKKDANLSTTKHKLRQKELGVGLLSSLQKFTDLSLEPKELIKNTLQEINNGLKMDGSIMVMKAKREKRFDRIYSTGKHEISDLPDSLDIQVPDKHWTQGFLLINSSTEKDEFIEQLQKNIKMPFFICLPWMLGEQLCFMISGRFKEASPFSPKLDKGDVEILQSILSYMSARLDMQTLKNQEVEQERIQAELKLKAEQEHAKLMESELRAEAAEAQARALDAEERRKREELERARTLQLSLLPKEVPEFSNYEITVCMITATEVGGDYYDFFVESGKEFTIAMGDASGHGTSAGIMMAMTKVAFKSCPEQEPAKVLGWMNNVLKSTNPESMNMALNVMRFSDDKVRFASAAIPPVFYYNAESQQIGEIMISGIPLGAIKNVVYKESKIIMKKGDQILLLTDGLPESENKKGEQLGYGKMVDEFQKNIQQPLGEQLAKLVAFGENWREGRELDDDITIMMIKRTA